MIVVPRARAIAKIAVLASLVSILTSAAPALAFAPEAASAVARRAAGALPLAARWSPVWDGAGAEAVMARFEAEWSDPEARAEAHRFAADRWSPSADVSADAAADLGGAPFALAQAAAALREAFASRDPGRVATAIADVAVSATDLADPFQTTSFERDEVPGARAVFGDLLGPDELAGLGAGHSVPAGDPMTAGISLALESAAFRSAIEDAARIRDDATVAVVRRDRLEAALSISREIVLDAWRAAGSPGLAGGPPAAGRLGVWPNPARAGATLAFTLPATGQARVEILDVTGRRVWAREARLPAGPQTLAVPADALGALEPGCYFARVRATGLDAAARLIRAAR